MSERWVKASYVEDESLHGESGKAVWVNMAHVRRIVKIERWWNGFAHIGVTNLELGSQTFGPFVEPPEHFLPHQSKTFPR